MTNAKSLDLIWGIIVGLLIGAGVFGHALRLQTLGFDEWTGRHVVAGAGVLLYLISGILVYFRKPLGLWIAIIGPLTGIIAVVLSPNAHIDSFQLILGIPQFLAIFLSIYVLLHIKSK